MVSYLGEILEFKAGKDLGMPSIFFAQYNTCRS